MKAYNNTFHSPTLVSSQHVVTSQLFCNTLSNFPTVVNGDLDILSLHSICVIHIQTKLYLIGALYLYDPLIYQQLYIWMPVCATLNIVGGTIKQCLQAINQRLIYVQSYMNFYCLSILSNLLCIPQIAIHNQ